MDIANLLQDDFGELYHGAGLDQGLTPEEFVVQVKVAADIWLESDGVRDWLEYMRDDEARERALEEKADEGGYRY